MLQNRSFVQPESPGVPFCDPWFLNPVDFIHRASRSYYLFSYYLFLLYVSVW